jgi:hypothetical protein
MSTTPSILRRRSMLLHAAMIACAATAMPLTATAADMAAFSATLTSSAEVPPNNSPASGTLDATLDKGTRELNWKATYIGLTGPATMAHFHGPAMPGANAGVVVPFPSAASPAEGSATLTPAQAADLVAGKWYVNVHTAQNPGGEIRGQVLAN